MDLSTDYTAQALARIRYYAAGRPDVVDPDDPHVDEYVEYYEERAATEAPQYAEQLAEQHQAEVEQWQDTVEMDEDGDPVQPMPDMLASELAHISSTIAELERYRRHLVAFATRYALADYSQRDLARITGVNHATISRWLTDPAIHDRVRAEVQPLAAGMANQVDVSTLITSPGGARTAEVLARLIRAASPDQAAQSTTKPTTQEEGESHVG